MTVAGDVDGDGGGVASGDPRSIFFAPDAPTHRPWYRRRGVLVAGVVVAILAVTVLTDLPTPESHADDVAGASAFVKELNTDLKSCTYAVQQATTILRDAESGVKGQDPSTEVALVRDDATACSFANPSIVDLSNVDGPGTPAATQLAAVLNDSLQWSTSDALAVIDAVQTLLGAPSNQAARTALASKLATLASDRTAAVAAVVAASTVLRAPVTPIALPQVTDPASP